MTIEGRCELRGQLGMCFPLVGLFEGLVVFTADCGAARRVVAQELVELVPWERERLRRLEEGRPMRGSRA